MMKKKNWFTYIPYGIVLVLLIIAAFYDYPIAQYIYHPNSVIGILFERIVLIFIIFLIPFGFYCLYRVRKQKIWLVFYGLGSVYWLFDAVHYWIRNKNVYYIIIPFALIVIWLIYQCLKRIPETFFQQYERFLTFVLFVFLSAMFISIIWKTVWGRMRYREMLDNASLFTPWFLPQGITGYNSFPSGHTTAMCSILCFLQLHRVKRRPRNNLMYLGVGSLIILMMISRMIMGAHFLSDVSMGFALTYTMYLFWKRRIYWEEVQ